MPQRQRFLTLAQCLQQLLERIAELQAAQAGRVRRADVDGDVAGVGVDLVQADQVVVDRALHRGIEVLADVDPQHAAILRRTHPRQQVVDAVVVETHAIDDRVGLRQAEQARPGIARLRSRSDGADLDEAETELAEPVDGVAVLVQARGQPHRVGKPRPSTETGRLAGLGVSRRFRPRRPPAPIRSMDSSWEVSGDSLNSSWRARVYMVGYRSAE